MCGQDIGDNLKCDSLQRLMALGKAVEEKSKVLLGDILMAESVHFSVAVLG